MSTQRVSGGATLLFSPLDCYGHLFVYLVLSFWHWFPVVTGHYRFVKGQ